MQINIIGSNDFHKNLYAFKGAYHVTKILEY